MFDNNKINKHTSQLRTVQNKKGKQRCTHATSHIRNISSGKYFLKMKLFESRIPWSTTCHLTRSNIVEVVSVSGVYTPSQQWIRKYLFVTWHHLTSDHNTSTLCNIHKELTVHWSNYEQLYSAETRLQLNFATLNSYELRVSMSMTEWYDDDAAQIIIESSTSLSSLCPWYDQWSNFIM